MILAAKVTGGKIGIIKDPFGKAPEYLGSTMPLGGATIRNLALTEDGGTLRAFVWYYSSLDNTPTPRSGLLEWKVADLIAAANKQSVNGQNRTQPQPINITAAKINLGYIYGMAASEIIKSAEPPSGPVLHYGDVGRIDLIKLIQEKLGKTIENIDADDISVDGGGTLVKTKDGKTVIAKHSETGNLASVTAATAASYAAGTPTDGGVIFIAPKISPDQETALRAGSNLKGSLITITVKLDKDTSIQVTVAVGDYTKAAGSVFFGDRPLADPGYTAFKLSGAVGESTDTKNPNGALDVFRVEQRLKYLGFPAFRQPYIENGKDRAPTTSENQTKPNDFSVDGQFTKLEMSAVTLFESVVNYNSVTGKTHFGDGGDGVVAANNADNTTSSAFHKNYYTSNQPEFELVPAEHNG